MGLIHSAPLAPAVSSGMLCGQSNAWARERIHVYVLEMHFQYSWKFELQQELNKK